MSLRTSGPKTQRLVAELRQHVDDRRACLTKADIEALEFARRFLKRILRDARKAERDRAGVDPDKAQRQTEAAQVALIQALHDRQGWTGNSPSATGYSAKHYCDAGKVVVFAQTIPDLLALIEQFEGAAEVPA